MEIFPEARTWTRPYFTEGYDPVEGRQPCADANMWTGVAKFGANEIRDMAQEESKPELSTLIGLEPECLVVAQKRSRGLPGEKKEA